MFRIKRIQKIIKPYIEWEGVNEEKSVEPERKVNKQVRKAKKSSKLS